MNSSGLDEMEREEKRFIAAVDVRSKYQSPLFLSVSNADVAFSSLVLAPIRRPNLGKFSIEHMEEVKGEYELYHSMNMYRATHCQYPNENEEPQRPSPILRPGRRLVPPSGF